MTDINQTAQQLQTGELVELFTITYNSTVLNFTPGTFNDAIITFNSVEYSPVPVDATGFEWNGTGTLPTPKLRISNVGSVVGEALVGNNDLIGADVTRTRVYAQSLDDGDDPDTDAKFPVDKFKINQKTSHNKVFVEFELATVLDQQGVSIPKRQILRDACSHRYRVYVKSSDSFDYTNATCPYNGSLYFDENSKATDKAHDQCGKKYQDCKLRYGNNQLPAWFFPGVARVRY